VTVNKVTAYVKKTVKIGTAWFAVFTVLYFVLETSFFCCSSYLFPYAARVGAGFGIYPLLQTSKAGVVPENYTAIFGDSYGFGEGDYFLERQLDINPKFNTTHFLREKIGGDFVSFAIPGSSNLTGWIEDPISSMNYINATFFHHIESPEKILLFFYEGNDVQENYTDLQERYIVNGYDINKLSDSEYFSNFIQNGLLNTNQINIKSRSMSFKDNIFFFDYAFNAIKKREEFAEAKEYIKNLKNPPKSINVAVINNIPVLLPDGLSAPPIEMTESEAGRSLVFLNAIARYVRWKYKDSELDVIYIPSMLVSYRFSSDKVNFYNPGYQNIVDSSKVYRSSNDLCKKIQLISEKNNMNFYDTRPGIFKMGQVKMLHGPFDINHFNLDGYKVLSDEIFNFIGLLDKSPTKTFISACGVLPLNSAGE
jgi:hypothetical protein